jgi:hypothetical protein
MKIILFSPYAYYDVHAVPEAIVGECLQNNGNEIITVNCNSIYNSYCLCMESLDYFDSIQKKIICNKCKNNRDQINKEFNFKSINIDDFINFEENNKVEALMFDITYDNYFSFEYDNIPIGKFALYEFWLKYKLSNHKFPIELWEEYKANLKNALITYFGFLKICMSEKPDRITTYNSLYGVNRIVTAIAEKFGISTFTLHAGSHITKRISQMVIVKGMTLEYNRHNFLNKSRNIPLNINQIICIDEHVNELFNANSPWVYSIKSNKYNTDFLKNKLKIKEPQKVLLAVMRSNDERLAANLSGVNIFNSKPIFNDQYKWLEWLIKYANKNKNIFIIFRIHPREYPNKREKILSQNAIDFKNYLKNVILPNNFYLNLPSDNFSIHDLLKITDVVLNNSSSVGLEAAFYGLPVIGINDSLYSFDPNLQAEAKTIDEYKNLIQNALFEGFNFKRFILAYRWLNYLFNEVAIDISDAYFIKKKPNSIQTYFYRIINKLIRVLYNIFNKEFKKSILTPIIHRPKILKNQHRLKYAILNDQENDIGIFYNEKIDIGNETLEFKYLKSSYIRLMNNITSKKDLVFKKRFNKIISDYDI